MPLIPIPLPSTRVYSRRLGRVADFCPICRSICAHRLYSIRRYDRLSFIPLSTEQEVEMDARCDVCGLQSPRQRFEHATGCMLESADLEELIRHTNPELRERLAERLELERRVSKSRVNDAERRFLLAEPVRFVSAHLSRRCGGLNGRGVAALTLLLFGLGPLALALLGYRFGSNATYQWDKWIGLGAFLILFGAVLFPLTQRRRYARGACLRLVARALKPLSPTAEEMEEALRELHSGEFQVVRYVRGVDVARAIRRLG